MEEFSESPEKVRLSKKPHRSFLEGNSPDRSYKIDVQENKDFLKVYIMNGKKMMFFFILLRTEFYLNFSSLVLVSAQSRSIHLSD